MAGAFIEVSVDSRPVLDAVSRLLAKTSNLEPALRDIGEYLKLSHDERFELRTSPDGIPWAPVSDAYAQKKADGKAGVSGRRGNRDPSRTLELTGDLRKLLRYQVEDDDLLFGSDRVYAATHQFGRDATPARPFIGLSDSDEVTILDIIQRDIESSINPL